MDSLGFEYYEVEKDSSLKEISLKRYNNSARWKLLYRANKAIIKDPENVKKGTVLKIPNILNTGDFEFD
ncbi:MAG: hypothetical protein HRT89_12615 [Lentisphaeria bacterium]|nr:hypothetical protein [Lentisphaeria bacterium]NQZ68900.1 hypothetical protein [Lentisphaeria bacterium]